jgi:hypothetical protein
MRPANASRRPNDGVVLHRPASVGAEDEVGGAADGRVGWFEYAMRSWP